MYDSDNGLRSRLIAIDYDDTWTADPTGWRMVVEAMKARGHSFLCVTMRMDLPELRRECEAALGDLMPIVFTGGHAKKERAERTGFEVDIWVDDSPIGIGG